MLIYSKMITEVDTDFPGDFTMSYPIISANENKKKSGFALKAEISPMTLQSYVAWGKPLCGYLHLHEVVITDPAALKRAKTIKQCIY